MRKGCFITLEGCEGVGKSTQLGYLKEYLDGIDREVVYTREPGGTPLAEKIRNLILTEEMDALTEAYLFATARMEHINRVILPALDRDAIVLCDRYVDSSLAYQGFARGLGLDKVKEINFYALENCMPDMTVFLDMDPRESFRKKSGKHIDDDRLENETTEFHARVYEGFKVLAREASDRYVCIVPQEDKKETARLIREAVEEGLKRCL